jgi:UDP-3-O-[3-hydroxymyristoyl] glucosamine N-acyltransferase
MADSRFFRCYGPFALGDLAQRIGAELLCPENSELLVHDIAALDTAGRRDLSHFCDSRYSGMMAKTGAGAVLTTHALSRHAPPGVALVLAADPRLAYAQAADLFYPGAELAPGIDRNARIDPGAKIGADCRIEAGVVIGPGTTLGARCHIAANAVIGSGVVIGEDCRIGANTTISHALIGARVAISTCVSIGGPGFGFVPGPQRLVRMPQLGRVIIEDDVTIDANSAVDRGANGDTVIGRGTVIDNLVQIGHNVRIGRFCAIAGQTGIAGSTVIGDGVLIGGQVGIADHLTIGNGARIAIKSAVIRDVEAGTSIGGHPAVGVRQWHRQTAGLLRLFSRKRANGRDAGESV